MRGSSQWGGIRVAIRRGEANGACPFLDQMQHAARASTHDAWLLLLSRAPSSPVYRQRRDEPAAHESTRACS